MTDDNLFDLHLKMAEALDESTDNPPAFAALTRSLLDVGEQVKALKLEIVLFLGEGASTKSTLADLVYQLMARTRGPDDTLPDGGAV